MAVLISDVEKGSLCARKRVRGGDTLLCVNGHEIVDVLDYRFYIQAARLELEIRTEKGKTRTVRLRKDEQEDIGLVFETYLMDKQRPCANKCIFCFIDQLPHGMRDSLYFKDDDARLSFLFGNYITMTNLSDREAQRIIDMHISPVNVSVHTMNPDLRVRMMGNRRAGDCLKYLRRFANAGLRLNTQLVLCPGVNDGEELRYSLDKLAELLPALQSIAAVPVGLTAHREGLAPLCGYTPEGAAAVIEEINRFNADLAEKGIPTVAYAADEFYLKAGLPIPDDAYYGDYPQLENGVGMWALTKKDFEDALEEAEAEPIARHASAACGKAAYPLIASLAQQLRSKFPQVQIDVFPIENRFFGKDITVSGLLTGQDILEQMKDRPLGEALLFPASALRQGEDVFLDDRTPEELERALGVPLRAVSGDGADLLDAFLGH